MPILPAPVTNLSTALERLPGIGPKTASRLTFFLLRSPDDVSRQLAEALLALKSSTAFCKVCFNITSSSQEVCDVCANPKRANGTICVVEEPLDVIAIESTAAFSGRYHVLHGVLSPIEGIGPEHLRIRELLERLRTEPVTEIILATNPSMEGDATALFLKQQLAPLGIRMTRLARGLPAGGDLEYADQSTLLRALAGRQDM
ncbi:recombination mediator RecR [Leptolinea tardivitalis]|uniref:Recombination protein RecR n=1 Tax=Leptolinea tardivitalis TaxID=229920 RepID=A0A0P6XF93_9CHLR|nr:recombination mediator RecR [Leptolinea tardivitalis]KPL73500.1 recombinase RecR [Leptolinea tardivitalis]GAP21681.1 DNA replication and repair protein RecR [Leptolinea tardivitalis]